MMARATSPTDEADGVVDLFAAIVGVLVRVRLKVPRLCSFDCARLDGSEGIESEIYYGSVQEDGIRAFDVSYLL